MRVYGKLLELVWWLVGFLRFFLKSGKPRRFLDLRTRASRGKALDAARAALRSAISSNSAPNRVIWLHVASAGELEQAIPPLKTVVESLSALVFVTYFSPSAEPFLKNVPGLVGTMAFPPDSPALHEEIFSTLGVTDVVFVRYDLWPGLVWAAVRTGRELHLLAATASATRKNLLTPLSRALKEALFRRMTHIFAVTEADASYFRNLKADGSVHLAGDPKWARARDRAMAAKAQRATSRITWFIDLCELLKSHRALAVFGSPHREEHGIAMGMVSLRDRVALLYVPHEVTPHHVAPIVEELRSKGARTILFSELEASRPQHPDFDAIVVDRVGFLAELYALADVAVVGGGFDGQVHNTLEPAAHPVPTLFGSNVARAREALRLLETGGALGFTKPEDMLYFLERCFHDPASLPLLRAESSDHPLAVVRGKAASAFADIPNTSEIVCSVFARQAI